MSTKTPQDLSFLPPQARIVAQQFLPRIQLGVQDVCPVLGMSRDGLYKRLKNGTISLKVNKNELGRNCISLFDLIEYLCPGAISASVTAMPSESAQVPAPQEKRRGRPRKPAPLPFSSSSVPGGAK